MNAFLSFVVPMVAISVLNGVIANQLLRMFREAEQDNRLCLSRGNPTVLNITVESNRAQSLRHGVLVLRKWKTQTRQPVVVRNVLNRFLGGCIKFPPCRICATTLLKPFYTVMCLLIFLIMLFTFTYIVFFVWYYQLFDLKHKCVKNDNEE